MDIALAIAGNPVWTATELGEHVFDAELTTVDDVTSNNQVQQLLSVGCGMRLVLPVSIAGDAQ